MRDTYADTTLARPDLGFAPSVSLEEGIERSIDGFRPHLRARDAWPADAVWRRRLAARAACDLGAGPPGGVLRRAEEAALGTLEPDKFLFGNAAPTPSTRSTGSPRASTSASWSTAIRRAVPGGREAGHRRHVSSAKARRSERAGASTSSVSSCRSTRRTNAPTTRSTSWRCRTSTRCTDPNATRPKRSRRLSS